MSADPTEPFRIALVGPTHPYKGGVAAHTTSLAHHLAEAGYDVRIECWSKLYPERLYPGVQRVDVPELPPFPRTSYPLAWNRPDGWVRLGRRLQDEVDAVLIVLVTPIHVPAYRTLLAAAGRDVRSVCVAHNVVPHERRRWDRWLTGRLLRRVDAVLVHGEEEAAAARELTSRPVFAAVLPPFLPSAAVPAADGPGGPRRGRANRLLFFGLVRPYKGLDVLIRAMADVPAGVGLTVVGEFWGGTADTQALIMSLGLGDRVELRPGYLPADQIPAVFAAADALVMPYRTGTGSQHVMLAHARGLPVVATTAGSIATGVREGVDGLLVPPDDPAALAAALRHLYEPGVLEGLRAGVVARPSDGGEQTWARYLAAIGKALHTVDAGPYPPAGRRPPAGEPPS